MSFSTIIIILFVVAMIGSLACAMWFMLKDRGNSNRTVIALTARISIWVALFAVIVCGIYFGWITPSNTIPMPS